MTNRDAKAVKVTILGNEYTIRGEADEAYIQKLAAYVNGKMNEIGSRSNVAQPLKISILTAINLADEVFRLRAQRPENEIDLPLGQPSGIAPEAIAALSAHIDAVLNEDPSV